MKILEDKAKQEYCIKLPLKCRCPHCDSLLLLEEGDCKKRYDWVDDEEHKKYYHYVVKCLCCEKEFSL